MFGLRRRGLWSRRTLEQYPRNLEGFRLRVPSVLGSLGDVFDIGACALYRRIVQYKRVVEYLKRQRVFAKSRSIGRRLFSGYRRISSYYDVSRVRQSSVHEW